MRSVFLTLMVVVCSASGVVRAQDTAAAIRVTTTLHDDGSRTVTTTDVEKRTSEATTYDPGERMRQRVVYTLDEQNQPVSGIVYDPKGKAAFKSIYKRDASNRLAEQWDYTPTDKLLRRMVFEYGSSNRISRVRTYDANGVELVPQRGASKATR